MSTKFVTLTMEDSHPDLVGTKFFLQVDGHPRIRVSMEECTDLGHTAQEVYPVEWHPVHESPKDECLRFKLTSDFMDLVPSRAFETLRAGRPIEIPGPIGLLCSRVGGVKVLAEMMQCSVEAIERWSKGERKPSGPARVLLGRIGEDYGIKMGSPIVR